MKINHSFSKIGRGVKTTAARFAIITLLGAGPAAFAGSPSELLEKGIYSEETKGDFDAALELYQQVIAEAKGGQALAAQAQYRLAVCYYKKKNFAEATAAFEKLVKDFPDQKDLIARASEYLAGTAALMPVPWVDGEELRLDIKLGGGLKIGTGCYTANSGETNGQKIWRLGSRMSAGAQSFSRVEVDADTFKPLHSRWKHNLLSDVDTVYSPGSAALKTAGKDGVKTMDLNGAVLDNEETIQWMRRLPLADGYKTSARLLASLSGMIITVKFDVTGPEKVEAPAGTFDCYKVELNIGQTFWYSADAHRYLVKFEAGGALAELASIRVQDAASPVSYQDATDLFSLSAPAGWMFDRSNGAHEDGNFSVAILDPEAVGSCDLEVKSLEKIPAEKKKTLRNWAESEAVDAAGMFKDFKIRAGSWTERTVGGQAAVSFIADYASGKDKNVAYGVFTFGAAKASVFQTMIAAKDFDAFKPRIDAVIDSYKAK
jgi:hypothetical protein